MRMVRIYKPSEFASLISRSVKTLQKWDREGKLKASRTVTNRRYYTHDQYLEYMGLKASHDKAVVVYYRVSSASQKGDLDSQKKALEQFCAANGYAVTTWLCDIGSGLNYKRKNFVQLMDHIEEGKVSKLIIAHKDRLVRFGYEWFEGFSKKHGAEIIVMNQESLSPEQEMTHDLLSIIHCFSSRLYGLRKYIKKLREELKTADENDSQNKS